MFTLVHISNRSFIYFLWVHYLMAHNSSLSQMLQTLSNNCFCYRLKIWTYIWFILIRPVIKNTFLKPNKKCSPIPKNCTYTCAWPLHFLVITFLYKCLINQTKRDSLSLKLNSVVLQRTKLFSTQDVTIYRRTI